MRHEFVAQLTKAQDADFKVATDAAGDAQRFQRASA